MLQQTLSQAIPPLKKTPDHSTDGSEAGDDVPPLSPTHHPHSSLFGSPLAKQQKQITRASSWTQHIASTSYDTTQGKDLTDDLTVASVEAFEDDLPRRCCSEFHSQKMVCGHGSGCCGLHNEIEYQEIVRESRRGRKYQLLMEYPEIIMESQWSAKNYSILFY